MTEGQNSSQKKSNKGKKKEPRVSLVCGFPLRLNKATHFEVTAFCFGRMSINKFYKEAIKFAKEHDGFMKAMEEKHPRNEQQGHYTYITDTNTLRTGRIIE